MPTPEIEAILARHSRGGRGGGGDPPSVPWRHSLRYGPRTITRPVGTRHSRERHHTPIMLSTILRRSAPASRLLARRSLASKVTVCGDESAFDKAVASEAGSVVYFTASWCGPCQMISPIYAELASEAPSGATFLKVDVDDHPEIAASAGVSAMPTFKFFKAGALLDTVVGANVNALKEKTETHLS